MGHDYERIADDIIRRMRRGRWQTGARLPALSEFEKRYPQSRMTLYRAMKHLSDQGYVTIVPGRGAFVKSAVVRPRVGILVGAKLFAPSANPFAFLVLKHAQSLFAERAVDSQLFMEEPASPTGLPKGLLEELDRRKLAGLLTVHGDFPECYMRQQGWKDRAVPHVNIGALPTPHRVYVDRARFVDTAISHMLRRGLRRALLLHRDGGLVDHARKRAKARGINLTVEGDMEVPETVAHEQYGFEMMQRVWGKGPRPEAIIVPDDVLTKGVAQACLALGIRVPDQCLLISLVNRGAGFFYPVPVVAIEIDVERLVATAAGMLIDMMQGTKAPPKTVLVRPTVPVRTKRQ